MVEETYFHVKVPVERVTLSPKGIVGLGIECFASDFRATKKYITLYFKEKDEAEVFLWFINRHARPSSAP